MPGDTILCNPSRRSSRGLAKPPVKQAQSIVRSSGTSGLGDTGSIPSALPARSNGRQDRGLRFLHSTANPFYDHKNVVRTPDFKDRLGAASAAKKAQIERALAIAEDPARLRRIAARSEIIAARNIRIAERERVRREAIAREAAERATAEVAEAAAKAAREAEEEAREARRVEQARLDAAAAAEREETLLAIRRAGRKKKKRKGH
jgi:hypothetical protein